MPKTESRKKLSGPLSLFRQKIRMPASLTFTKRHHEMIATGKKRLNLSRSDYVALLIETHGETVQIPPHLAPPPDPDDDA